MLNKLVAGAVMVAMVALFLGTGGLAVFTDSEDVTANTCPRQCIPSYTTYNARLTYEPANGDWWVALFGTNVTDEFYWQQYSAEITVNAATGAITNPAPAGVQPSLLRSTNSPRALPVVGLRMKPNSVMRRSPSAGL